MRSVAILLVEDEKAIRESLHELLEEAGFGVLDADAGDIGLQILKIGNVGH